MNQWPEINGREGDEYITLNKGDILGTGIIPPAAPSELNALPLSNREIELNWKDNSNNETGFNIERKTINSSYFTIAKVDEDSTNFVGKPAVLIRLLFLKKIEKSKFW